MIAARLERPVTRELREEVPADHTRQRIPLLIPALCGKHVAADAAEDLPGIGLLGPGACLDRGAIRAATKETQIVHPERRIEVIEVSVEAAMLPVEIEVRDATETGTHDTGDRRTSRGPVAVPVHPVPIPAHVEVAAGREGVKVALPHHAGRDHADVGRPLADVALQTDNVVGRGRFRASLRRNAVCRQHLDFFVRGD